MRVTAIKQKETFNRKPTWKANEPTFCCGDAKDAWRERAIGFGEYDTLLNTTASVCIYVCHPWPEGAAWDAVQILYCPFCGDPIEVAGA